MAVETKTGEREPQAGDTGGHGPGGTRGTRWKTQGAGSSPRAFRLCAALSTS